MKKCVLFIHGAGAGAYEDDRSLAASLRSALGAAYDVRYPRMPDEENAPYGAWKAEVEATLAAVQGDIILVGHSVGGSFILKWLSEASPAHRIGGVFVIAAPYWGGKKGWRYEGYEELALPGDAAMKLGGTWPLVLYHSRDDDVVPFDHLAMYAASLPRATTRAFDGRGHQFGGDLAVVARDIKERAL